MTIQDDRQNGAATGKTRIWVRVLLAVSLTLNLLVIGAIAGAHLRRNTDQRQAGPMEARSAMRDLGYGAFIDALPRDQRRALGQALRERGGSFAVNRTALAEEFKAMLAALRADPFVAGDLQDVLEQQGQRVAGRTLIGRQLVLERIAAMPLQDRQAFADRLEHALRRALDQPRP